MTSIQTEPAHTGEFLLSEGPGNISREQVNVAAGAALPVGQLLAAGANSTYVPFDKTAAADAPAIAVLYRALDESAAVRPATIVARLAEVAQALLVGYDVTALAGLASKEIIVRV
jgi:hypothetical protein